MRGTNRWSQAEWVAGRAIYERDLGTSKGSRRMRFQQRQEYFDKPRREAIVGSGKMHEIDRRRTEVGVERGNRTPVAPMSDQPDARIGSSKLRDDGETVVSRTVIDNNDFVERPRLRLTQLGQWRMLSVCFGM